MCALGPHAGLESLSGRIFVGGTFPSLMTELPLRWDLPGAFRITSRPPNRMSGGYTVDSSQINSEI